MEGVLKHYYNVENIGAICTLRGDGVIPHLRTVASDSPIVNKTRNDVLRQGSKRLGKQLATNHQTFVTVTNYTDVFNTWVGGMYFSKTTLNCNSHYTTEGRRIWVVRRTLSVETPDGVIKFSGNGESTSQKVAMEEACKKILSYFVVSYQADEHPTKESIQGDVSQQSVRNENTIITRDQQSTVSDPQIPEVKDKTYASSEPLHEFNSLVGRWMPINKLTISTNNPLGTIISSYYLPETFLSGQATSAPNTVPFESFVYGQYDLEMKFVVNANKFQCGKVIVSVKFDSYQADSINDSWQAALGRPHIILDLSANNEGTILIPFKYHRAFVRNQTHATASVGIRPGKYASVYVQILSPLKTGPGGANNMDIRPFYRYKRAEFAGMSYKVALTQMDTVASDLVQSLPTKALKSVLVGVEKTLDQIGQSHNQDKPTDNRAMVIVPKPRLFFSTGKGLSDASPLRMNPTALTNFNGVHATSDEPKTTYDIARIWGLRSTFNWSQNNTEGEELFNTILDPGLRLYDRDYSGAVTPMEYVVGMYQFWSGPIELRFDFVSNSFHTGAVIISAEYNRTSTSTNAEQSHCTYTKTFHLGEQKSVSFTVPYIYDTVYRRNTALVYNPILDGSATSDSIKNSSLTIRPESKMRVKVRVINALRPVSSAPSTIEVLCFMRAGKNFTMHSLKQMTFTMDKGIVIMDRFPLDGYRPIQNEISVKQIRGKRETKSDDKEKESDDAFRYLPTSISNKWNEVKPYPHVQMDNGEKENEDETENFNDGENAIAFQTMDTQLGIKDILRRPVLLINNARVFNTKTVTGYFIPLMPPSRMLRHNQGTTLNPFTSMVCRTPQAALMNLFRFWRGSMRYTIIVHTTTNEPVYITHIPHSGVRLYGNVSVNGGVANYGDVPIYGCGLSTDILIPSVNSTACIEVPFDTENNWALTFEEDAQRNYSWRDKADTNSGHIAISCNAEVNVSVWWSAGDDFEVANFYGVPNVSTNEWAYDWNDSHARVQIDELPQDFSTSNNLTLVGSLKEHVFGKRPVISTLVRTGVCAIPYVGPAYATMNLLSTVDKAQNIVESTQKIVNEQVVGLSAQVGTSIEYLLDVITSSVNKLLNGFSLMSTYTTYCYDMILDVLVAWYDEKWTAVGVGIVRFLTKILGNQIISALVSQGLKLGEAIATLMKPTRAVTQGPPPAEATLTGILAGIVGTLLGVKVSPYTGNTYLMNVVMRLTESRGVSYLMGVLRFVEATFVVLRDMIMNALGYISPETMAIKMLAGQSTVIQKFVSEAQLITTEANAAMVQNPGFRYRFWNTVMQAYQIQKLLATVPSNHASPVLSRLCNDVIKMSNEKFVDISASPVRYEPFVICIEGPSGIGKSELVEALAASLLKGINLQRPHSGATYFRMPGSRFWSGYRDQPIVVYDEWANLTEPTAMMQQISEMFQLKSTSTFIPEMAHLEEKKIRGNPLVVILLCNKAFPDSAITGLAHTPEAIYRRRDVLLYANRKAEYADVNLRNMSHEEQVTFANLEFRKYRDAANQNTLGTTRVNYEDMNTWLCGKFARWHAQEQNKVRRRLDLIRAGIHDTPVEEVKMEDPFQLYYTLSNKVADQSELTTTGFLPSEILEAEVKRIALTMEMHQDKDFSVLIPQEPTDIFGETVLTQGFNFTDILGIFTSRFALQNIFKYSHQQIMNLIDWIGQTHHNLHVCCVCQKVKNGVWICITSELHTMGKNTHYVCAECMQGSVDSGAAITTCPMCRSGHFKRWMEYEQNISISVVGRALLKGLITTEKFLNIMEKVMGGSASYCLASVFRMSCILTDTLITQDYEGANQRFSMGASLDTVEVASSIGQKVYTAMTQGDIWDEIELEQDDQDTEMQLPMFKAQLNLRAMGAISNLIEAQEYPCIHDVLSLNTHNIRFSQGYFLVPHGSKMLKISENPCSEECPLKQIEWQVNFYTKYLKENYLTLESSIYGYVNAPENKEWHLNKIPTALRPSWMDTMSVCFREVEIITKDDWWNQLSDVYEKYKVAILTIGGIITAVGGLMMMKQLFSSPEAVKTEVVSSGDEMTRNLKRTVRSLQRSKTSKPHFQTVEEHPDLETQVKKYVARNYVTVSIMKTTGRVRMTICGIYGHYALLPRHYVKALRKAFNAGEQILMCPVLLPHEEHEYTYDEKDFTVSEATDLALWKIPMSFGMFKDIRKFIVTDDDLTKSITTEGSILLAPSNRNAILKEQSIEILGVQSTQAVEDTDGEWFEAHDVICYNYSQPGACGSLVFQSRSQRPILAMHFAGLGYKTSGEGFGVILTKEALGEIMEATNAVVQLEDWEGPSLEEAVIILPDTNVSYIGAVSKEQTPFQSKKSKIKPSLIQGVNGFEPLTEPCILDKTDKRYVHDVTPLVAGCIKHGQLTRDFGTSKVERAKEALWEGWISNMKPCILNPKKLTPAEAVVGIPGVEYYDPLSLNTSAGFPYNTTTKKTKSDYIEYIRDEQLQPVDAIIDDIILNEINRKDKLRAQGIQPITPFIDTLKDERKKPEKVRKLGGTRVFCNSSLDYVITMRQNFLHFSAAFMKQRFSLMHSVGINPTGTEWTQLANRLIGKSINNICTIDYSNFGPGFNAQVAEAAAELIIRWTKTYVAGIDERVARVIMHECLQSVHLCHNTLYHQKCGSPSGGALTVIINTLVNQLYVLIAWEALMGSIIKSEGGYIWEEFKKRVALFCYGDDLIMSVLDNIKDKFNAKVISEFFKQYGITATDASKGDEVIPYEHLTKATFLKHAFVKHSKHAHIWQSALDWTSINDTTQWIWECANYKEATRENCAAALQQAHGHGPIKFQQFKNKINGALMKKRIEPLCHTWEEIDSIFYPDLAY